MVSTLDSESNNPSSSLGRTSSNASFFWYIINVVCEACYFNRIRVTHVNNRTYSELILINLQGESANAVPHYQKYRTRVTRIWSNRRGQPQRSAMQGPHSGRTAFVITVSSVPGKYELCSSQTKLYNSLDSRCHRIWKCLCIPSLCTIMKYRIALSKRLNWI